MSRHVDLIVGLGNPGKDYEKTRHNVGFMAIDRMVDQAEGRLRRKWFRSCLFCRIMLEERHVCVLKPLSFMNRSGQVVSRLVAELKLQPASLLIVLDDVNLPLGQLRLRVKGSAGGHNGLMSILRDLGTDRIPRLRIGIDFESRGRDMTRFVLEEFRREEMELLDRTLGEAVQVLRTVIGSGYERAMNRFNQRGSGNADQD